MNAGEREQTLRTLDANAKLSMRLDTYVELLSRWRKVTNLISETTYDHVWSRHIADSAQLLKFAPAARSWIDMGSGAGFPGMVIAIQLADSPGARIHCIESDQRKCAFLREVARATGAPVSVHGVRLESLHPEKLLPVDAVTSRALAPLPRLIEFASVWISYGAVGIFPRGRSAGEQIATFSNSSEFQIEVFPSELDCKARIVCVRSAKQALL